MNIDNNLFQFSPIIDYKYSTRFQKWDYNNKEITDTERTELVSMTNEQIALYSEGLSLIHDELGRIKDYHDDYHDICRVVFSVFLFVIITQADCLTAFKYFLIADKDYDKRYLRGKMKITINEGFKKLYGFNKDGRKISEWARLASIMAHFPTIIKQQYKIVSFHLEDYSKASWWKNDRDLEVHYHHVEELLISRKERINESKVAIEFMKLFDALMAVNEFLTNVHNCLHNTLVAKYYRGEIATE